MVSASSQSTSKGDHRTAVTLLTTNGERLVLGLSGHAVARLRRHLQNAMLPRTIEAEDAA